MFARVSGRCSVVLSVRGNNKRHLLLTDNFVGFCFDYLKDCVCVWGGGGAIRKRISFLSLFQITDGELDG